MLDLRDAAARARERIIGRLAAASTQKSGLLRSVEIIQRQSAFRSHLLDALRKSRDESQAPSNAPDALFLALPERLLAKWYYLAFGPQREDGKKQTPTDHPQLATWKRWDTLGGETRISNFSRTSPHAVFVAHGLAPIWDSTLLLADLGRAARVARALNAPLHAMVADVSWMSYNRSVRRFDISEKEIESGLHVCLDRRERLYKAFGVEPRVHAITAYEQKGSISNDKIRLIAERYLELVTLVWGPSYVSTEQPLADQEVSRITKPLASSLGEDSPLRALASFPGALNDLEQSLRRHLDIVRTMAKRFRMLSIETFSYYFAQYYAQTSYRGQFVKVAPISERDFDEPFDDLDASFRLWGEGDKASVSGKSQSLRKRPRLTAIYLPQYRLGKWELLPYTPLSLDAVAKGERTRAAVEENVLLVCDFKKDSLAKTIRIVADTLSAGAPQLNRVCADVLSFITAFVALRGDAILLDACKAIGTDFADVLRRLEPQLVDSFAIETESDASWAPLWVSWLDAVDSANPLPYVPSHIALACKTEEDWSADALEAAAELLMLANGVAYRVSTT